jgi:hypothetical protein
VTVIETLYYIRLQKITKKLILGKSYESIWYGDETEFKVHIRMMNFEKLGSLNMTNGSIIFMNEQFNIQIPRENIKKIAMIQIHDGHALKILIIYIIIAIFSIIIPILHNLLVILIPIPLFLIKYREFNCIQIQYNNLDSQDDLLYVFDGSFNRWGGIFGGTYFMYQTLLQWAE